MNQIQIINRQQIIDIGTCLQTLIVQHYKKCIFSRDFLRIRHKSILGSLLPEYLTLIEHCRCRKLVAEWKKRFVVLEFVVQVREVNQLNFQFVEK